MAAWVNLSMVKNAAGASTNFVSLPYNMTTQFDYNGDGVIWASEIVRDIEGSLSTADKINKVYKWNTGSQGKLLYQYFFGVWQAEGGAQDFVINPGDGIGVEVVSAFTWEITGMGYNRLPSR